jgi:putative ABC transport system permease protein
VLTYKFWRESQHSDPNVLGKTVRLESVSGARSAVIVGVLEPSVPYPVATEIIANIVTSPHHLSATMVTGRDHRMTEIFARLARGATLEAARAELSTAYSSMTAAHPETYKPEDHYQHCRHAHARPDQLRANTILWVLFAASGLLFVIASSNVANLVLARTVRREPELAVRSALGASRAILRRSLLAESLVLCGSGAIARRRHRHPHGQQVLGHYAARFSVRATGMTLDFSLVWFGVRARPHRRRLPRLHSPPALHGVAPHRRSGRRRNPRHRRKQLAPPAHLRHPSDHRILPAPGRLRRAHAHAV